MSNLQYELNRLCETCELGEIIEKPQQIFGGLLHTMYAIKTTSGNYAIKRLNEEVMYRPTALQNFINSERIATVSLRNHIPALPAKTIDEQVIQQVDERYFLIYDWIEGKSLRGSDLTHTHCERIGYILGEIHRTDFESLAIKNDWTSHEQPIDWDYYVERGKENHADWVALLEANMGNLHQWTEMANDAAKVLSSHVVISHRDLDPKNVLWSEGNPVVIDWESAGYINPLHDLLETAVYWSERDGHGIEKEKFFAFIEGYKKIHEPQYADWKIALATGFSGKLGWLEYNLKRSLGMESSDESEQELGASQVTETLQQLKHYADSLPTLENWLTTMGDEE